MLVGRLVGLPWKSTLARINLDDLIRPRIRFTDIKMLREQESFCTSGTQTTSAVKTFGLAWIFHEGEAMSREINTDRMRVLQWTRLEYRYIRSRWAFKSRVLVYKLFVVSEDISAWSGPFYSAPDALSYARLDGMRIFHIKYESIFIPVNSIFSQISIPRPVFI